MPDTRPRWLAAFEASPGGETSRRRLGLLASMALALGLRFLTMPGLTREGLRLVSMDDYGHLRRAILALRQFPHLPVLDPYLNHPHGGLWIWPPLFDLSIALPARLLFGANAEVAEVTLMAALVPPVLGTLSILPLYFFARRVLGTVEAWAAVGIYAFLPAAVSWSSFGHADQHAAEALGLLLVLLASSRVLGPRRSRRADASAAVGLALALGGSVLTWQGAIFVAPIVAGAALVGHRETPVGLAHLGAAVLVLPVTFLYPGPVTYISFSSFQPLFLALVGTLLLATRWRPWGFLLAVTVGLVALVAWPPLGDGVRHLFSATSGAQEEPGRYLAYPREWLTLIAEYRPLLQGGPGHALSQLSVGLVLLPIVLALWIQKAWREASRRGSWTLLVLAGVVVLAMALSQRRYAYYLVILVALALAAVVGELVRHFGWAGALPLPLLALITSGSVLKDLPRTPGAAGSDVFWTLDQLAELDPPPNGGLGLGGVRPGEVPGVLAPWSLGHLVTLQTGRPAVADPFGYGFLRQSEVLTAPPSRDAEVHRRLRQWNCRYLITTDLRPVLSLYARAVGRHDLPVDAMLAVRAHSSPQPRPVPYLQLVITSRTGWWDRSGTWVPRLKVFRILDPPRAPP